MPDTPPPPSPELTLEHVEQVREKLRGLPELDRSRRVISRVEAIRLLKDELEELRKRGYSISEIAAVLTTNGIRIAKPTLTAYLRKPADTSSSKRPKRTRTKALGTGGALDGQGAAPVQPAAKRASTEFRPPDEAPESRL
jgi:hypothetical protein